MKRLKQNPDKTDHSDARLLADLVWVGYLPKVWLAPPVVWDLRKLVRYRRTLVRERANIKLRIRAILREECVRPTANPWTKAWRAELLAGLPLDDHARWVIAPQLRRLEQLNQDVAADEARMAAATADARLIAAGNRELRVVLIEAARRLCWFDPRWQSFALRMRARGKSYNVVVLAVANPWIRGLYHQLCQLLA